MSSTRESSESSRTLPRAELNPLLNPVLASHMGRWAEVYFTSPPEKREEAVLELLRELEAEDPGNSSTPAVREESTGAAINFAPAHGNGNSATPPGQTLVRCQRCGNENPSAHQFCGMCGSSLQAPSAVEIKTDSPYGQHEGELESRETDPPFHAAQQTLSESNESRQSGDRYRSDPYDLSMLQGLRQREIDEYEYEEPPSHSYRYYIGAVLTLLLLLLGYMAWRSGQLSQSSHQVSSPPPPAPTENVPAAQPPSPQAGNSAPQPNSSAPQARSTEPSIPKAQQPPASSSNTTAENSKQQPAESASRPEQGLNKSSAPVGTSTTPGGTEPQFSATSGADDLAMAQRYLKGANGQARDPAEAAKWLWKAMGKHNGPATLQLADLYLKGDGVAKNCEQARVLLDTAAIRGMKGAGERLRNLQAFGCQ